jgi:hypothetical protein
MILLVVTCNFLVVPWLLTKSPNLAGWIIGYKWDLLQGLDKPADWLILGDSSCNQGVDPAVVETELGGDAINLCTIGDMLAVNDAWMLEWHIAHYGAPRGVLLVHVYDTWHRSFKPVRMGSIPLSYRALRRLGPPVKLRRSDLMSYLATRYFPLYANNMSLQYVLRLGDPGAPYLGATQVANTQGFLAAQDASPDHVRRDARSHVGWLNRTTQRKISADNARSLRQIAGLAERYDFDVYLATAPTYVGLAADPMFQRYYADLVTELAAFAPATGRVHLLLDLATFPAESMQNADHLILEAAQAYTRRLTTAIRRSSRNDE